MARNSVFYSGSGASLRPPEDSPMGQDLKMSEDRINSMVAGKLELGTPSLRFEVGPAFKNGGLSQLEEGTELAPVIWLNLGLIAEAASKNGRIQQEEIEIAIAREMAYAWFKRKGVQTPSKYEELAVAAETFAREFSQFGYVDKTMLEYGFQIYTSPDAERKAGPAL
jgi:hypothetical protein